VRRGAPKRIGNDVRWVAGGVRNDGGQWQVQDTRFKTEEGGNFASDLPLASAVHYVLELSIFHLIRALKERSLTPVWISVFLTFVLKRRNLVDNNSLLSYNIPARQHTSF